MNITQIQISTRLVYRIAGLAAALFGISAFLGYATELEILYRPISDGPATHPLTALSATLLGLTVLKTQSKAIVMSCCIVLLIISALVIVDHMNQSQFAVTITPFSHVVAADLSSGLSNSMGFNTALMYFFLTLSLFIASAGNVSASQIIGFLTLALPTVSFVGYTYGLDSFHGQMSILTAITGLLLCISVLFSHAEKGPLKAMLSKGIGGRVARTQAILGYLFPFIFGYLISRSLSSSQNEAVSIVIVAISWAIVLLAAITAMVLERIDDNMEAHQNVNALKQFEKYQETSLEP